MTEQAKKITQSTLIPIGMVATIVGAAAYIIHIQNIAEAVQEKANANQDSIVDIQKNYISKELFEARISPIADDLKDIKQALRIK